MSKIRYPLKQIPLFHTGLPVYLLSTISKSGITNVAPFSMAFCVSYKPPYFLVCFEPDTDSLRNVRATKNFVLNIPRQDMVPQVGICADSWPAEVSEFDQAGLTPEKSLMVKAPSVKECPAHIECIKEKLTKLPTGQHLCIARVVALRGEGSWESLSFVQQKQKLKLLYAFRPGEGNVPFFSLGRYLGSV